MAGLCHHLCGTHSMTRGTKLSFEATVKSGTHSDGHFTYDSKDLRIAACTSNEQQHSMIFQDLAQRALSQLDKHSEELAF